MDVADSLFRLRATVSRVLIVEDDYTARLAMKRILDQEPRDYECTYAGAFHKAQQLLKAERFDVVVSDIHLGDGTAFDLMESELAVPFIFITGATELGLVVRAMRRGAFDYLIRDAGGEHLRLLPISIERALQRARKDHYLKILSGAVAYAPDAIYITSQDGVIIFVNAACETTYHRRREEMLGKHERVFCLEPREPPTETDSSEATRFESIHCRGERELFPVSVTRWIAPEFRASGLTILNIVRDISEQKEKENKIQCMLAKQEQENIDFQAALDQLRIGVLIVDDGGNVVFVNHMIQLIRGHLPGLQLPVPWQSIFPLSPGGAEALCQVLSGAGEKRGRSEIVVDWPNGRKSWLEVEAYIHPLEPHRKVVFVYDQSEVQILRRQLEDKFHYHGMIAKSESMQTIFHLIEIMRDIDSTVLIEGETGTGKELVARAIHATSTRKACPFIAINCATFTETLLASQLFGHRQGAFTGATSDSSGLFETANGGTVFLDEIGEMPLILQGTLLRVLDQREIVRVGEILPRKVDVRIIAATNRDLEAEVAARQFRGDLFYRLRVARITLPPLRQRREDIPLLAHCLLASLTAKIGRSISAVDQEALGQLLAYEWPGNVRELINALEFAILRCSGNTLHSHHLPPEVLQTANSSFRHNGEMESDDSEAIRNALRIARGNRSKAAKLLGYSRATFYRRIKELGLELN